MTLGFRDVRWVYVLGHGMGFAFEKGLPSTKAKQKPGLSFGGSGRTGVESGVIHGLAVVSSHAIEGFPHIVVDLC